MVAASHDGQGWVLSLDELRRLHRNQAGRYWEMLRVPSMSVGFYSLAARARDPQSPHREDEIYVVVRGRGQLHIAGQDHPVAPGSVAFVRANVDHRFHSIVEPLEVVVVFAPAETVDAPARGDHRSRSKVRRR